MSQTLIPKPVEQKLLTIRDRIKELKKKYGSLARYGYPILQSEDEVIALVYAVKYGNMSIHELANTFNIEKMTVYRWFKSYEKKGCFRIYKDGRVQEYCVSPDEVKKIVEEDWLKPSTKKYIKEVYESKCVQDFLKNPLKRSLVAPDIHGEKLSSSRIKTIISRLANVVAYINEHKKEYPDLPSNPDEWDRKHESLLIDIITKIASERMAKKERGMIGLRRLVRSYLISLRALPCINNKQLFKGKVGSATKVAIPIEETLFLDHYLKLKRILFKESRSNEDKAFFTIMFVHIWTGAREGWSSLEAIARVKSRDIKDLEKADLDDPDIDVGLIGLKWSKAIWEKGKLVGFRIWESKTGDEWVLRYRWLDDEMADHLERIYEFAKAKGIDSVVKSILMYYRVKPYNGTWSVNAFKRWYKKRVKEIPKLLGEKWKEFTPHRLRSAHISILAELRIPLEIVLSNVGFGSGWFDLNTARIYYLRFSQPLISEYLARAKEIIMARAKV